MKNIKLFLGLCIAIFTFASCTNDVLEDVAPVTEISTIKNELSRIDPSNPEVTDTHIKDHRLNLTTESLYKEKSIDNPDNTVPATLMRMDPSNPEVTDEHIKDHRLILTTQSLDGEKSITHPDHTIPTILNRMDPSNPEVTDEHIKDHRLIKH